MIVMTTGFCHMANGPVLSIESQTLGRYSDGVRFTGDANRAAFGDLLPLPAQWPNHAIVEDLVARYLTALRTENRSAFTQLQSDLPTEPEDQTRLAFGNHAGFRDVRRATNTPQMALFVEDPAGPAQAAREDEDDYPIWACFCRTPGCSSSWPISTIDADNHESRPYVCAELGPFSYLRPSQLPSFRTQLGRHGLPGPNTSTR